MMLNIPRVSEAGLINDIETQLVRLVDEGFRTATQLRYLRRPNAILDVNPNEVQIADLPAVYVWCTGFGREINTMGAKEQRISRKFEFYCNVQYIMPKLEERAASKELRQLAWWLFSLVDSNLDLNGWTQGDTGMEEVDLFPKAMLVDGQIMPVSSAHIKVVYPFVDMAKISRNANKYTRR